MSVKKTKNEILGITQVLASIDPKDVNQKTAYWIGRNLRKIDYIGQGLEELKEKIRKDSWFEEYNTLSETDKDTAAEKFKDELAEADKEVKEYLDEEVELSFYTIKIDNVDVKSELIPYLLDLISE